MKKAKRVVVVGARRKRQGTGPFVAATFAKAGAEICGIVGTSQQTVELARQELNNSFSIDCPGYISLDQALLSAKPDILAVCSPFEVHLDSLERAAAHGIHCLCEKPLWWQPHSQRMAKTTDVLKAFQKKGCFLQTITQWPYTLPYFFKLFPEEDGQAAMKFEMEMSPREQSLEMIPDSVPHLFSMLYTLAGSGEVENPKLQLFDEENVRWRTSFQYRTLSAVVETIFDIVPIEKPPRPAAYGINGKKIRRRIILPEYSFCFDTETRSIPVTDPLDLLIGDFLESVYSQKPLDFDSLFCGMKGLDSLATSIGPQLASLKNRIKRAR